MTRRSRYRGDSQYELFGVESLGPKPCRSDWHVCDGCGQSLDRRLRTHVELGPVLHDHIWQQLADPREALCFECMCRRAVQRLGRVLTLADLRPCPWNLFGRPYSWFDLFVEMEGTPASHLDEWPAFGDGGAA
jgi:hypothetical protein